MDKNITGILFIVSTVFISALSVLVNSWGVKGIDPTLYAGLKNLLVGVVLGGLLLFLGKGKILKKVDKKNWLGLLLVGLLGGSIPFILFFQGLKISSAINAGFLHKTMFIYVGLLAVVFLKEKISKKIWLGMVSLFVGLLIFSLLPGGVAFYSGDLLILLATILWSGEIIISKKLLRRLPVEVVAGARMFFGAGFIWIWLFITGRAFLVTDISLSGWGWVGITSLFLFGYVYTFYRGLQILPAHFAASLLSLAAPLTIVFSMIIKNSQPAILQLTGAVVIIVSVFYMLFSQRGRFYFSKLK